MKDTRHDTKQYIQDNAQSIGARLRNARGTRSLTEVANAMGASVDDIVHIEYGTQVPTPMQMVKLSNFYNVEISEIMNGPLPYTTKDEWLQAYIEEKITEGALTKGLKTDRINARLMVAEYESRPTKIMTDTVKLLTGEAVYEVLIGQTGKPWNNLDKYRQNTYCDIAKQINQRLGICESCGNRPADGQLFEITDEMWCSDCLNPPVDTTDPNIQLMHFVQNEDGTLAGAIVPPKGMSLEEYQAQLKEEMSHYTFSVTAKGMTTVGLKTLSELLSALNQHVPYPTEGQKHFYTIWIYKDYEELIGKGDYRRTHVDIEVVSESGAAKGLNNLLYEYAFNHV